MTVIPDPRKANNQDDGRLKAVILEAMKAELERQGARDAKGFLLRLFADYGDGTAGLSGTFNLSALSEAVAKAVRR